MCSLSIISTAGGGYRLVHSRDEQRSRSEAAAPAWHDLENGRRAMFPVDPDSGGTWVALRDDGACLAIMNVNPEPPPELDRSELVSRGKIVPALLEEDEPWTLTAIRRVMTASFAPFRLVAVSPEGEVAALTSFGGERSSVDQPGTPAVWASSGLGDSVVEDRIPLFEGLVGANPTAGSQDAFHAHRWPGRGAASVLMSRRDARTVSVTSVSVERDGDELGEVRMDYTVVPEGPSDGDD
ncbi:MAG: hypothetical protein CMJ31_01420 [Phycisphaerae bacterium]|nr:hypothetical protein [Phycisphaerae bacterium]